MKVRPVVLGAIAGAIGVVCNALYMARYEREVSGGRRVDVLVANETIVRGKPIREEALGLRSIPQAYVDDRAIRAADKTKVANLRATSTITVGQTVVWSDVVSGSDETRDLSSLVQPGNRAMPVNVYQRDILQLIKSGDFVDVIAVINGESTVLLQRVLVLATGTDLSGDRESRGDRGTMLTVSVSVAEGQLLALAMDRGRLTVAVRNPDDQRVADTMPDVTEKSLLDPDSRRSGQRIRHGGGGAPVQAGPTRLEESR